MCTSRRVRSVWRKKLMPESLAVGRARDQSGEIGDHERVVLVRAHDAERAARAW